MTLTPWAIRTANRKQRALCKAEVARIRAAGERYVNGRCVSPPQAVIADRDRRDAGQSVPTPVIERPKARPARDEHPLHAERVRVWVTPDQRHALEDMAERANVALSVWIRRAALRSAGIPTENP
jgi:hypothetical protein